MSPSSAQKRKRSPRAEVRHPLHAIAVLSGLQPKELARELGLKTHVIDDCVRGRSSLRDRGKANLALIERFGVRPDSTWEDGVPLSLNGSPFSPAWLAAWRQTLARRQSPASAMLAERVLITENKARWLEETILAGRAHRVLAVSTPNERKLMGELFGKQSEVNFDESAKWEFLARKCPPDLSIVSRAQVVHAIRTFGLARLEQYYPEKHRRLTTLQN
jgi:hypothetical protein